MKRLLIAVLALGIVATTSAQHKRERKQGHHRQQMAQQLNLSEAQRTQAKALAAQYKTRMQELNKNEGITVKEYRDKKEALRKEQKAGMQALLTPEQRAQVAKAKADRKAQHEAKMARRMKQMQERLQLSEAQVAQMQAARQGLKSRLEAIKSNQSLSRQQRKEQLMALKKERKAQFDNMLTPEQKEKMKALRQKRGPKTEAK
jgi:Spy/CpxP family protein refolding chaperone